MRLGIERSIIFLAMIIIGGTGSVMGTLMGTAFVVLLPESMEWISAGLKGSAIDKALSLNHQCGPPVFCESLFY